MMMMMMMMMTTISINAGFDFGFLSMECHTLIVII